MSDYCITSTPTIMDGTVVRWYASEAAESTGRPIISASRHRVTGHGGSITPELFEAAWAAHLTLKRGDDVEHLATHRRRGLFGELEPVDDRRGELPDCGDRSVGGCARPVGHTGGHVAPSAYDPTRSVWAEDRARRPVTGGAR